MKLKRIFLMLTVPLFCGSVVFGPAFASSNEKENSISSKRPRTYETDFPSIPVTAFGVEFNVFINGFNDRPMDEICRGVKSYIRSRGVNLE